MNLAKHVADQLLAHGKVARAWLGVQLADLTPEIAEGFGIKADGGVVISSVLKDQPAERAGLRRNDVIVEFDGQPVTDLQKFRLRVADTAVGRRVPVVVLRDGKRVTSTVTLGPRDQNVVASNEGGGAAPAEPAKATDISGLRVRDMTPEEKTQVEVKNGVIVSDVKEESAADDAGLSPNDVIEEVGGKPVQSAAGFTQLLKDAKAKGKHAVLLVHRGGNTQFVALPLSQ